LTVSAETKENTAPPRIAILLNQPTQFEGPLFQYAAQGNIELTVFYVTADESMSVFDAEINRTVNWGIDLLRGYNYKKLPSSSRLRWLWNELRASRYDCLIINGYFGAVYQMALAVAKLQGIRTALRIDAVSFDKSPFWKTLAKRLVYAFLFRLYDHFFAASSLTIEYLRGYGVPQDRISRFPYTVDTEYFSSRSGAMRAQRNTIRARHGIPADARVILAIAKLTVREAPWDLLRALVNVRKRDVWTLMVGDGDQRRALEAYAQEHDLKQVVFTGYMKYTDLVAMYVAADVFVHAASSEPWGVSVHEAIACDLPVVASSNVGAAYDLLKPGQNGYMYAAGDPHDLQDKLLRTIDELDPETLRRANRAVLEEWNYRETWAAITSGCLKCMKQ
jgi:glycosyltransferase involved in cell wall biosynthesis